MKERGHTAASRLLMAELAAIRIAEGRHNSQPQLFTKPELAMASLLEAWGFEYEPQRVIGTKTVDFYLTGSKTVIEVDGVYWHPDGPDVVRDAYILAHDVRRIIHVTDLQLKAIGWL